MLYLEFREKDYNGCHIEIMPEHQSEIPRLRDMIVDNLVVENPAHKYIEKMQDGEYDELNEEEIDALTDKVDGLALLWNGESRMNVMMLLSRAMQTIVDLRARLKETEQDETEVIINGDWDDL